MTTETYWIHDLILEVRSERPEVLRAIRRRLLAYTDPGVRSSSDIVEVDIGAHGRLPRPPVGGRPVYDSPVADVSYHDADDLLVVDGSDLVEMVADLGAGAVRMSVLRDCEEAWALCAHPLLTLCVLELMKRRRCYPLHAGGVVVEEGAVLLPGASGAGKTTLTTALLEAGAGFLSDDMVFLRSRAGGHSGDRLEVLSFADELDVTDTTAAMFTELADLVGLSPPSGRTKHQVRAEERFGSRVVDRAPVLAVVLPTIAPGPRSTIRRADAGDLLATLAPNVLLTDPAASQGHFDMLAELVDAAPVYRMDVGHDLGAATSVILHALADGQEPSR
ncbi:MAG: hypothetical protein WKF43_03595 [Acidimicrobiales bacterium]